MNPRHIIQEWLIREAEKRGLRCKVEFNFYDSLDCWQYWFVVGGLGSDGEIVRDEIAYMRHGPRDWWPIEFARRTGELAKIESEEELRRVLSK